MTGFEIVSVRERPDLTDSAVAFFQLGNTPCNIQNFRIP